MAELKTINGGDLAGFQYYDLGLDENGQSRRVLAVASVSSAGVEGGGGTVALDAATLAALETINVGNFPATQPVSAVSLPLPTGAATAAQIGEVQASPTANTLLDRLKTIATGITNLLTGIVLGAGENHLGAVGGHTTQIAATFTRPGGGDTTAYAAGDAVSNSTSATTAISFLSAARVAAGSGIILSARLVKSTTAAAASGFRLWLYTATPSGTLANDNAAFSINAGNKAVRLGYIDLTAYVTGADCVEFYGTPVFGSGLPFKLSSGTTIFALLQSLGAFTPASGEVFDLYINEVVD